LHNSQKHAPANTLAQHTPLDLEIIVALNPAVAAGATRELSARQRAGVGANRDVVGPLHADTARAVVARAAVCVERLQRLAGGAGVAAVPAKVLQKYIEGREKRTGRTCTAGRFWCCSGCRCRKRGGWSSRPPPSNLPACNSRWTLRRKREGRALLPARRGRKRA
jgi:hypothetical protein